MLMDRFEFHLPDILQLLEVLLPFLIALLHHSPNHLLGKGLIFSRKGGRLRAGGGAQTPGDPWGHGRGDPWGPGGPPPVGRGTYGRAGPLGTRGAPSRGAWDLRAGGTAKALLRHLV